MSVKGWTDVTISLSDDEVAKLNEFKRYLKINGIWPMNMDFPTTVRSAFSHGLKTLIKEMEVVKRARSGQLEAEPKEEQS